MKTGLRNTLILANALTLLIIIVSYFLPLTVIRTLLGLPLLLVMPGFTLISALFPRKDDLDGIERAALSFALSIIVVPIVGLILNYTPWGISIYPILISLAIFIMITSGLSWFRQHRLAETERLTVSLVVNLPWRGRSLLEKTLLVTTIIVILGAIGTLGYAIVSPRIGERFTEFYITGLDGQLVDFSEELTIGEEGQIVVSVANHEHEYVSYQVEVRLNGMPYAQTTSPELDHGEKWVDTVSFVPDRVGDNQKVELILYKMGESEPYRGPLRILINVSEPE
jgi:uncharacterized membrane protein